eukprot:PhM_4_TR2470/c1_g2_i2/m.62084
MSSEAMEAVMAKKSARVRRQAPARSDVASTMSRLSRGRLLPSLPNADKRQCASISVFSVLREVYAANTAAFPHSDLTPPLVQVLLHPTPEAAWEFFQSVGHPLDPETVWSTLQGQSQAFRARTGIMLSTYPPTVDIVSAYGAAFRKSLGIDAIISRCLVHPRTLCTVCPRPGQLYGISIAQAPTGFWRLFYVLPNPVFLHAGCRHRLVAAICWCAPVSAEGQPAQDSAHYHHGDPLGHFVTLVYRRFFRDGRPNNVWVLLNDDARPRTLRVQEAVEFLKFVHMIFCAVEATGPADFPEDGHEGVVEDEDGPCDLDIQIEDEAADVGAGEEEEEENEEEEEEEEAPEAEGQQDGHSDSDG